MTDSTDERGAAGGPTDRQTASPWMETVAYCASPSRLRRTVAIALVVGTLLTLFNQGDVILAGQASAVTLLKGTTNYLTPFVVSNLGLLAGRPRSGGAS